MSKTVTSGSTLVASLFVDYEPDYKLRITVDLYEEHGDRRYYVDSDAFKCAARDVESTCFVDVIESELTRILKALTGVEVTYYFPGWSVYRTAQEVARSMWTHSDRGHMAAQLTVVTRIGKGEVL